MIFMKKKIYQIKSFLSYVNRAGHCSGHNVHSPFAFDLITNVIEERHSFYIYSKIESIRKELLLDDSQIYVEDFGTGKSGFRKISNIAKRSLKKTKEAQLLHRLAWASRPCNVVELGTSLGITTAYFASIDSRMPCYSLEASSEVLGVASQTISKCGLSNVSLISGDIKDTLPILLNNITQLGFVFFDANHTKQATLEYFDMCLSKLGPNSVFVFDDIHASKGMTEAWSEIISNSKVRLSLDLFSFGIVYFNLKLNKQHLVYLRK